MQDIQATNEIFSMQQWLDKLTKDNGALRLRAETAYTNKLLIDQF